MWRTTYLHGPAVLRRICRLGRAPRNMTPTGRKWTTRLPAIRARTLLSQKPILESLVCPNKASVPVIAAALLTQAESADCPRLLVCPGARCLVSRASADVRPGTLPSQLEGPRRRPGAL